MKNFLLRYARRAAAALTADIVEQLRSDVKKLRTAQADTRLLTARIDQSLQRLVQGEDGRPRGKVQWGERIPSTIDAAAESTPVDAIPASQQDFLELDRCAVCHGSEWTDVCEYNKFLLLDSAPDAAAAVYRYAMCHACGITFARRRPTGARYVRLVEQFDETIGRSTRAAGRRGPDGSVLNPNKLSDQERAQLSAGAARGVFVSEHDGHGAGPSHVPMLLRDRLGNSLHIEILTSLLSFTSPRVLELRPRVGSIGAALKRVWGAEVYGLPLFESQQLLNREVYGHVVDHLLDYDRFTIPYPGQFDLVVANHMMTHAVRPRDFLDLVRERLAPGGALYLYNEPDDAEFLEGSQSMINTLNPFHLQAFDRASLVRGLAAAGFETTFVTHERGNVVAIARPADPAKVFTPLSDADRAQRLARYSLARDLAILRVPDRVKPRFAAEWSQAVERAVLAGLADMTPEGNVRVRREAAPVPEDEHA